MEINKVIIADFFQAIFNFYSNSTRDQKNEIIIVKKRKDFYVLRKWILKNINADKIFV